VPDALDSHPVPDEGILHFPGRGLCEQDGALVDILLAEARHGDGWEVTESND
jgi:hypothetical protein